MRYLRLILLLLLLSASSFAFSQPNLVWIGSKRYYVHTVESGETLSAIAGRYSIDVKILIDDNPEFAEGINAGDVLKVRYNDNQRPTSNERRRNRNFDTHTVNQGETLYSISRRYEIPVETIIEDNPGVDPANLTIGQTISIRKKSRGTASEQQIQAGFNNYVNNLNRVSAELRYHLVERGETLYGISNRYEVTEQQIVELNKLTGPLRAGEIIAIPPAAGSLPIEHEEQSESREEAYVAMLPAVRSFSASEPMRIALLLPLRSEEGKNSQFLEFYRGFLLGLEDLKKEGVSAAVDLFNSARSAEATVQIIDNPAFQSADIIIGPVYESEMTPVVRHAERAGIPVISPLAILENTCSPVVYQMAPAPANKYDKLRETLSGDKNFIFVTTRHRDEEMEQEIKPLLPAGYKEFSYSGNIRSTSFTNLLDRNRENVFIISCTHEMTVDQILAGISSMQNNIVARSMSTQGVSVVGSSRWGRFRSGVDKNLFFKLEVCFITSYHADRSNRAVNDFMSRYVAAYGAVPSLYSFRGYDTIRLFAEAAWNGRGDFTAAANLASGNLLQMDYHFVRTDCNNENTEWALVTYKSDYTIEVR